MRIFNTFDYKYRQNLVSKSTNSDKSQTPQFRETAVSGCRSYFIWFSVLFVYFSMFYFLLTSLKIRKKFRCAFHFRLFTFHFSVFTFLNYAQNFLRFNFQRKTFHASEFCVIFSETFWNSSFKILLFLAFAFQKLLIFCPLCNFHFW